MSLSDLGSWITEMARPGRIWYAKRLAANDTLATHSHQAGPYIPKDFLFQMFPILKQTTAANTDIHFDLYIDSHSDHRKARAIWYNNKFRGGTRDETRITGLGGQTSALLDPDSTGALALFVFVIDESKTATKCHVWVCNDGTEAEQIEDVIGPVEPKQHVFWTSGSTPAAESLPEATFGNCFIAPHDIPSSWLAKFPSGQQIIEEALKRRPPAGMNPDVRLIKRRSCEFDIFKSVEQATYAPKVASGFADLESFLGLAQTVLQSRKSRSGNSLELHTREIFNEEGLIAGSNYTFRPVIEGGKRPDFIFPSQAAYEGASSSVSHLRMLAAKTTCKDRWRQILNEADKVSTKHLLTLQEGVSEGQFKEMVSANVILVVPAGLHDSYPKSVQPHLVTLEEFIGEVRLLAATG